METVVGIDIGGTSTKLGAINLQGDILFKTSFSTTGHSDENAFLNSLKLKVTEVMNAVGGKEIIAIGIGAPMANYFTGSVKGPANLNWKKEVNLQQFLEDTFDLPTVLTNDANLSAISEKKYGQAKNLSSFVSIIIGTGLGSGLYINNQLLHGKSDLVGELGHSTVIKDGRMCGCGKRGCLETYVSANGIRRTFFQLLAEYDAPSVLRNTPYDKVTPELIHEAAKAGERVALETFAHTGDILGMKIADSILLLEPEAVFLSGGLAKAGELLLKPTQEAVKKYLLKDYPHIPVLTSQLQPEEISILGGGALAWDHVQTGTIKQKVK